MVLLLWPCNEVVLAESPGLRACCAQTIVADNLDLGCGVIEKTAMDKAVREIDHHLMGGYEVLLPVLHEAGLHWPSRACRAAWPTLRPSTAFCGGSVLHTVTNAAASPPFP